MNEGSLIFSVLHQYECWVSDIKGGTWAEDVQG